MPPTYIGNPNNLPCPTRTFHTDTYPFISPTRPALSLRGKRAVITGAGTGIGRATALAFAEAGADLCLLGGRRAPLLEATRALVAARYPEVHVQVFAVDVTDADAVRAAVHADDGGGGPLGWDVLVLNSAYLSAKGPLADVELGDWWKAFEVNLKGNMILLQTLLPLRRPGASVLATSSLVINYAQLYGRGSSSYIMTKLALNSMMESLAAENADLHVVSFHPGGVDTDMYDKFFGEDAAAHKAQTGTDSLQLPAHFAVWLASPEARFLRGKFVYANWDMPELIEGYSKRIMETDFLTVNVQGWPFSPPETSI